MLATRTWVCRCGSPARLVRCRNPAATNPAPRSRRVPNSADGPLAAARLLDPRRTKQASRSNHATRGVDGAIVGGDDGRLHQRITQPVKHRHRLRCRERQVEPGDPVLRTRRRPAVRGLPRARSQPGQHRPQVITVDRSSTPRSSPDEAAPNQRPADLTPARVVVLQAVRNLRQVVALGADTQLPDRHHPPVERPPDRRNVPERHTTATPGAGRAAPWCIGAVPLRRQPAPARGSDVVGVQLAEVLPMGRRGVPAGRTERGQRYHRALRGLAARWMRVMWRCWTDGTTYDPARHTAATSHAA